MKDKDLLVGKGSPEVAPSRPRAMKCKHTHSVTGAPKLRTCEIIALNVGWVSLAREVWRFVSSLGSTHRYHDYIMSKWKIMPFRTTACVFLTSQWRTLTMFYKSWDYDLASFELRLMRLSYNGLQANNIWIHDSNITRRTVITMVYTGLWLHYMKINDDNNILQCLMFA